MSKLISWSYTTGNKKDKEFLISCYAENEEVEKYALENGFISPSYWETISIPYIKRIKKEGFTSKAHNHGTLLREMVEEHPDLKDKIKKNMKHFANYFEYFYLNLSKRFLFKLLEFVPKAEIKAIDNNIYSHYFYKKELFLNPDFIKAFDETLSFFANDKYENNDIVRVLFEAKYTDVDFFEYLTTTFDCLGIYLEQLTIINKKAYLKTLAPGRVELIDSLACKLSTTDEIDYAEWNGKTLFIKFKVSKFAEHLEIKPTENLIVKIIDEKTFIKDVTTFVN